MSEAYESTDPDLAPADPLLRPVWKDEPDETDHLTGAGLVSVQLKALPAHRPAGWLPADTLAALLVPLCDVQDVLARLDARAAAAPAVVGEGLCARIAFAEAAGWLAYAHAWAHPLDIALRDLGLTGSYSIATLVGRPMREMPNTFVRRATVAWEDPDAEEMVSGDQAVVTALILARQLMRLARTREDPFGNLAMASAVLNQLGPDVVDGVCFDQWREYGRAAEGAQLQLPPLLRAARTAEQWITGGIVEFPTPLQALLAATGALVGSGALRTVIPPLWTAYPTLGAQRAGSRAEACALPLLRSDVAARLQQPAAAPDWLLAFLVLLAEGARCAMRELDRLLEAAERGRTLMTGCDRRARLPAALDAMLRSPVLTPKGLAIELAITPQTATALLRELCAAELVTEITGRRSFRAFAIMAKA